LRSEKFAIPETGKPARSVRRRRTARPHTAYHYYHTHTATHRQGRKSKFTGTRARAYIILCIPRHLPTLRIFIYFMPHVVLFGRFVRVSMTFSRQKTILLFVNRFLFSLIEEIRREDYGQFRNVIFAVQTVLLLFIFFFYHIFHVTFFGTNGRDNVFTTY